MITPLNFNFAMLARLAAASVMTAGLVAGAVAGPASAHPKETIDYVALGDSYSAGLGAGPTTDLTCFQTPGSFPDRIDARKSVNLIANASCSGATTTDIFAPDVKRALQPQAASLTKETDLVTITIGGNDVGFGKVATACPGNPASIDCKTAIENALFAAENSLPTGLFAAFSTIQANAPYAHVVVLGYPQLLSPQFGTFGTSTQGAVALNSATAQLNALIEAAARGFGFQYVDVTQEFRNHGVGSPDPWIRPGEPAVFHPTAEGYKKGYFKAFKSEVQLNKVQEKSHSYQ
ncbi:MAG TPA: SGNH/GDSL hydrolase family protein [Arthrobacter sp.]|nr:SGNH/GDSL hydrolase family protein [Arthrobacter sp.]